MENRYESESCESVASKRSEFAQMPRGVYSLQQETKEKREAKAPNFDLQMRGIVIYVLPCVLGEMAVLVRVPFYSVQLH